MENPERDRRVTREDILFALGCFLLITWSISTFVALFLGRQLDSGVNAVMLAVAAGLFGSGAISAARRNGK